MYLLFSKPDLYIGRCGHLNCTAVERRIAGPAFMRGIRAALLCDTHVLPRTSDADIRALSDRLAALKPDMLFLGGDYADRREDALRLFEALSAIKPRLGGYGVPGNNDAEAWRDAGGLREAMRRAGFQLLVNEAERLEVNGGTLYIAGVDERKFGTPTVKGLYPEAAGENAYRILLAHYPCVPDVAPDLMLSGHTHGGQFNLLGLTPFTIGFERLFRRNMASLAAAGLHEIGGMKLLVSKGVGGSRVQWRVGVRPEIDVIDFD